MNINSKINFSKTIFVIDSASIALMVSIISKGHKVNCIFEKKSGIDNEYIFKLIKNFSHSCIDIEASEDIEVTDRYFLGLQSKNKIDKIKELLEFKRNVKSKFNELPGYMYIGPRTSSIMNVLKCHKEMVRILYHGTGEYCELLNNNKSSSLKDKIKHLLVKLIGLPNSIWAKNGWVAGYSMCDVRIPEVEWINCMDFDAPKINRELLNIKNKIDNNNTNVVFCPKSDYHKIDGIDSNTTKFNVDNIKILKWAKCTNCNIFIKFHPSLYQLSEKVINNLPEEVEQIFESNAYDLTEMIPDSIGGAMLPLEAIIRYIKFDVLICVESSTAWNLEKMPILKKLNNSTEKNDNRKKLLQSITYTMKKHGIVNDTYEINNLGNSGI